MERPVLLSLAAFALAAASGSGALAYNEKEKGDLIVVDGEEAWVSLVGIVQPQIALLTGDDNLLQDGDPAERMGFRIRRARLGLEGWAYGVIDWEATVAIQSEGARLLDAWVGYRRLEAVMFVLGAHKTPFSRFALIGSQRGTLSERPLSVQAMAPFRQVGLTVEGDLGGIIEYHAGVYNGFERNTNFHEGYVEGQGFEGNRFNRLAYAGRLALEPFGSVGRDTADLTGGPFRLGLGTALYFNDGDTTRTNGWEADLHAKWEGLHVLFEYLADTAEPTKEPETTATIPATVDRMGMVGELGYMILPGRLGAAVRAEWIDDDLEAKNNGDELVTSGGLQYYWHGKHLKASLDFTHREELEGDDRDNDTLLFMLQFGI